MSVHAGAMCLIKRPTHWSGQSAGQRHTSMGGSVHDGTHELSPGEGTLDGERLTVGPNSVRTDS